MHRDTDLIKDRTGGLLRHAQNPVWRFFGTLFVDGQAFLGGTAQARSHRSRRDQTTQR
jgi:hypothetical protein